MFTPDGKVNVVVEHEKFRLNEEMFIVPDEYEPLLGRTWIRHLKINLQEIDESNENQSNQSYTKEIQVNSIDSIIKQFPEVFTQKIGCIPNYEVSLQLRKNEKPIYFREREVPYALRESVEKELEELESTGIITKVNTSDWGSPLVVIPKPDGKVRLCVDYKISVNKKLISANYPIRKIDKILNTLKGSRYFCRLDLYKAYLHVRVTPTSSIIQTITTHRGTFKMNRLSFGIKTAPSEFNRIIDQILSGLSKTMSYFDDIIIHGSSQEECKRNLIRCLKRLQENDLHLNINKCLFFQTQIEYLGYVVSYNKIEKTPDKVSTILKIPRPKNIDDIRRFLCLVTYYARFITKISSITHPIRQLLQKNKKFYWPGNCEDAFIKLKEIISSEQVLMSYDQNLPIRVTCDASPTGLAGALAHVINDVEHPIAFVSRALIPAEENYTQLDREALVIVFTIGHFFNYLYGRKFELVTDNKPLSRI